MAQNIPLFHSIYSSVTSFLGLIQNLKKDGEGTTLECLGIKINTVQMIARLPQRKRERGILLVNETLSQGAISLESCQSLTGFLNFCCEVIPLGRTFLSRLYQFQATYRNSHAKRHLTTGAQADLAWWQNLLPSAEGARLLRDVHRRVFHLFTDASFQALGAFWYEADPAQTNWRAALPLPESQALVQRWASTEDPLHINTKEVIAIQASLQAWAPVWAHGTVIVHTDNNVALSGFNSGAVRGTETMNLLRDSLLFAAKYDLLLHATRVTSVQNGLADALSRLDWLQVANLCPSWQVPFPSNPRQTSSSACES